MKKIWYLIIAIILIIIAIIIFTSKPKKRAVLQFPTAIVINNYTDAKLADTIIMTIVNKILKYDTATFNVFYMPKVFNGDNIQIYGFITKVEYVNHTYNIYISSKYKEYNIYSLLSHELVHFDQMEKGFLIVPSPSVSDKYNIWMNDTIHLFEVPYENREYEMDAFKRANSIESELKNILFHK